jgi:hypothetical protein
LHLLHEHSRYELVSSSSQTLDFSKKKKGTQCDDIDVENIGTQVWQLLLLLWYCSVRVGQFSTR